MNFPSPMLLQNPVPFKDSVCLAPGRPARECVQTLVRYESHSPLTHEPVHYDPCPPLPRMGARLPPAHGREQN